MSTSLSRVALVSVLVVVLPLLACSHARASISGPGMNAKREANLLELASAETGCPAAELKPSFVKSLRSNLHEYAVDGCGKHFQANLFCAGVCVWQDGSAARKRAAFDLQCPIEQVSQVELPGDAIGMSGCGRTITYLVVDGKLVANSGTQTQPAPAPAPKPTAPSNSL